MDRKKDIEWFKKVVVPTLDNYDFEYRFYDEGDFGPLSQVLFQSQEKGGSIDFWGLGWLGIHLVDYVKEEELINVLLKPSEEKEQHEVLQLLQNLLKDR
jgi:hypothetical protein